MTFKYRPWGQLHVKAVLGEVCLLPEEIFGSEINIKDWTSLPSPFPASFLAEILSLACSPITDRIHDLINDVTHLLILSFLLFTTFQITIFTLSTSSIIFHLPIVSSYILTRCERKVNLPVHRLSICGIYSRRNSEEKTWSLNPQEQKRNDCITFSYLL